MRRIGETWRDVFAWTSPIKSGERGASWLDRVSAYPPSLRPATSDSPGNCKDPLVQAALVVAGAGLTFATIAALKSAVRMLSWRLSLVDHESKKPPPGPAPLPFIGNILDLKSNYYETLYKYVQHPAAVFWVMSTPFVVVTDAEGVRTVLGGAGGRYVKPKYFGYRSKVVETAMKTEEAKVAADAVDYSDGGDASRVALKALVGASFHDIKEAMACLMASLERSTELKDQSQQPGIGRTRQELVKLNLKILFSLNISNAEARRISDMIGYSGAEFARRMVNPMRVFVDIGGNIRYVRDVVGLIRLGHQLCNKLDEAVLSQAGVPSYAKTTSSQTAGLHWVHAWVGKVRKIGKLGKVVGLLMASSQTVPVTAVWMLHLVTNETNLREKLLEELMEIEVRSPQDLKFEHLEMMPLAHAVVCETLRLYPPFPLVQRQAQVDDVLGGIKIPAGTHVYIVPWLIHHNPKLWPSPHDFDPSRFLPKQGDAGNSSCAAPSDWAYIPFGRGPRMCAGSQLALAELKILLVTAVLDFTWTSYDLRNRPGPYPELGLLPNGIVIESIRKTG